MKGDTHTVYSLTQNCKLLACMFACMQGVPNNVHENFDNIVALLDPSTNQSQVQELRMEFEEYLDTM